MTERRPQVIRGTMSRARPVRTVERTVRTKSTSARTNGGGRATVRAAPARTTRTTTRRATPATESRPRPASRTRAASPARTSRVARPARKTARKAVARKPAARKAASSRPRAQGQRARSASPRRSSRHAGAARRPGPVPYAVKLLSQDHRALLDGAAQFEEALQEEKHAISERFCKLLSLHMQIEEELLYPEAHEALGHDSQRIATAQIEHAVMRDLVSQIEDMDEVDELFEAKMQVLTEMLRAHIEEEETDIFPRLERTHMDLDTIGEQLARRKQELSGDEELVIAYEYEEDEPAIHTGARRAGLRSGRNVLIHSGRRH